MAYGDIMRLNAEIEQIKRRLDVLEKPNSDKAPAKAKAPARKKAAPKRKVVTSSGNPGA